MARVEWISIEELAKEAGVSTATIRRAAGLQSGYPRRLDFRRRGLGRRSKLEFNRERALEQLRQLREGPGPVGRRVDVVSPTLVSVLTEIRALRGEVASLRAQLSLS